MSRASDRILEPGSGLAAEWIDSFDKKAADYGDGHEFLGVRGQFSDMNRKFQKLKRFMWDDPDAVPVNESLEEILFDMIGHCFLTIDLLRQGVLAKHNQDIYLDALARIKDALGHDPALDSQMAREIRNVVERAMNT